MTDPRSTPGRLWNRRAAIDGIRALLPMAPPVPAFGLVFGLLVTESEVVGRLAGLASGFLIFGGSSQLTAVLVLDEGGGALLAIVTVLVINARHVMYSAALQPRFRDTPRWFRIIGSHVLVDQTFAATEPRPDTDSLDYRVSHFLTAGAVWMVLWLGAIATGILIGNVIPASWSLDFAVPLLFLALLINAIRDRPGVAAAAVAGAVAV
ncbi:MAG: AzlC family ABC transporter permease, partial [Actinomycetota bacterium]